MVRVGVESRLWTGAQVLGKETRPRGGCVTVMGSTVRYPEPQRKGFSVKLGWNAL